MKKLFIIFLLINLFSCSNTKSTWDCPILGAGNGNCRSIKKADLNHQIVENKNEFFQLPAKINIKTHRVKRGYRVTKKTSYFYLR